MGNTKQDEKGKKFFFATTESKLYDATILLTVPYYDLIHRTLIDILNYHFGVNYGSDKNDVKGVFLDVGAGTGKESLSILRAFPNLNVLAVDLAEPMKEEFRNNYDHEFGIQEVPRYTFLVSDILNLSFDTNPRDYLKAFKHKKRVAAVSAYCIHHFELNKKQEVYQRMYDFLDTAGILINIDLFNYKTKEFSKHAHEFDIEYIKSQFDNPNPEFIESNLLPHDIRMDLKEKWIDHMNNDNILNPVEKHLEMLRGIGFTQVECVFRYFQQGIVVAIK